MNDMDETGDEAFFIQRTASLAIPYLQFAWYIKATRTQETCSNFDKTKLVTRCRILALIQYSLISAFCEEGTMLKAAGLDSEPLLQDLSTLDRGT